MPEGPEVETDELRERMQDVHEHEGGTVQKHIAKTTAVLAVFAAVSSLRAGATVNEALMERTEATRLQTEASDQWAFYQAKGLKASAEESARASWLALGKEPPSEYAERKARYVEEQKAIEERAHEKEKERDARIAESDHLIHRHHRYANAVAIFQVAIALGAVAALTRSRAVWFLSILLGAGGIALFAATLAG